MIHGTHNAIEDPKNANIQIMINDTLYDRKDAKISVFDRGGNRHQKNPTLLKTTKMNDSDIALSIKPKIIGNRFSEKKVTVIQSWQFFENILWIPDFRTANPGFCSKNCPESQNF